jgi:hypothetical protein
MSADGRVSTRWWVGARSVAVAAAATAAVALGACDGDDEPAGDPPAATPPVEQSVDRAEVAGRGALAAYTGMWAAYDAAGRPPAADPNSPELARYADGSALDALVNGLVSMSQSGLVFEGQVVFAPEVVNLSLASVPTRARIEDCADSSGSVRVRADGEPFEDEPGGLRRIFADLEQTGEGVWKVMSFAVLEVGSCVPADR